MAEPTHIADDIEWPVAVTLEPRGRDRLALREVAVRHYDRSRAVGVPLGDRAPARRAGGHRRGGSATTTKPSTARAS